MLFWKLRGTLKDLQPERRLKKAKKDDHMKQQQNYLIWCKDPNAYYTNNFDKLNCG